jgi:hypothetical protein
MMAKVNGMTLMMTPLSLAVPGRQKLGMID